MALPNRPRAVVTGAGSGLGRAVCKQLARRNARLIVADIRLAAAEETVAMLGSGIESRAMACDVAHLDEVEALAAEADRIFGGTDLVVNNAGVAVSGKMGEVPIADWQWIIGVNLFGVVHGCHAFVPRFRKQGRGAVLNVASAAGFISPPNMSAYCATKAAVFALSESLSAEVAKTGISVSVLCPGFFPTNIIASSRATDPKLMSVGQKLMAKSHLSADDVARIALEGVDAGRLYVVPHSDARWLWRLKRLMPGGFATMTGGVAKRVFGG